MLTRARVKGYKSLHDIDVRLNPLTVLCGPNSSGKSNFLDALRLLSRIATKPSLEEAFETSHRGKPLEAFSFGDGGVGELLDRGRLALSLEVDLRLSDAVVRAVEREIREAGGPGGNGRGGNGEQSSPVRHRHLRYRVGIEMCPKTGALRVADERLAALNADGTPNRRRKPFIESEGERLCVRGRDHPAHHGRRLGHSLLSTRFHTPHHPHLGAAHKELEMWQFFCFEPRGRMRAADPLKETPHIGVTGEGLASFFLTLQARKPRQFDVVNRALRMLAPGADGIVVGVNRLGEVGLSVRENGAAVPTRELSDGTLRILGLLALGGADEPPALIGLEEPESGVHPEQVELVATMLGGHTRSGETQCIATTHSTVLLDHLPEESLLFARKADGRTGFRTLDDWVPFLPRAAKGGALGDGSPAYPLSHRILRGDFRG